MSSWPRDQPPASTAEFGDLSGAVGGDAAPKMLTTGHEQQGPQLLLDALDGPSRPISTRRGMARRGSSRLARARASDSPAALGSATQGLREPIQA